LGKAEFHVAPSAWFPLAPNGFLGHDPSRNLGRADVTLEPLRRWMTRLAAPMLLVVIVVLPRLCAAAFVITPARDMVRYVEAAELLRTTPLGDAVRSMDCHPLYPAALLAVRTVLSQTLGLSGPTSWVAAGESLGVGCYVMFILTAFAVGTRLWDRTVAFWGCAIAAVLPRQISYTVDVLTDSLHAWLWMTCVWFLTSVDRPKPTLSLAFAGLVAGFAYWTRSEAILLPAMALLGGLIIQILPAWRLPRRQAVAGAAAFAICWAIPVAAYVSTIGRLSPRNTVAAFTGASGVVEPGGGAPTTRHTGAETPARTEASIVSNVQAALSVAPPQLTPRPYVGDEAYEFRPLSLAIVAFGYEVAQETRVWMLPFAAWGLFLSGSTLRKRSSVFLTFAWLGYTAMLTLLQVKCGYIAGRYLMPLMPMLGISTAIGIRAFIERAATMSKQFGGSISAGLTPRRARQGALLAVVLAALGTSAPAWFRSNHRFRQTYLDAAEWLKTHTQPGEAVFDPVCLVSFYADRPNWKPIEQPKTIPVRYGVIDLERVYRTDGLSHLVIRSFGQLGRPVAEFRQRKSNRQGVVYIYELPVATAQTPREGIR